MECAGNRPTVTLRASVLHAAFFCRPHSANHEPLIQPTPVPFNIICSPEPHRGRSGRGCSLKRARWPTMGLGWRSRVRPGAVVNPGKKTTRVNIGTGWLGDTTKKDVIRDDMYQKTAKTTRSKFTVETSRSVADSYPVKTSASTYSCFLLNGQRSFFVHAVGVCTKTLGAISCLFWFGPINKVHSKANLQQDYDSGSHFK